jgi:hypothetical protein
MTDGVEMSELPVGVPEARAVSVPQASLAMTGRPTIDNEVRREIRNMHKRLTWSRRLYVSNASAFLLLTSIFARAEWMFVVYFAVMAPLYVSTYNVIRVRANEGPIFPLGAMLLAETLAHFIFVFTLKIPPGVLCFYYLCDLLIFNLMAKVKTAQIALFPEARHVPANDLVAVVVESVS